jgi:oligo-alginate lyase
MKLSLLLLVLISAGVLSSGSLAQTAPAPPHLLLGPEDFVRLNELAPTQPWAKEQRDKIIAEAAAFPDSYEKTYGLSSVELPPEGGQWMAFYACPDTGTHLEFVPPNHNVCPDTGKEYNEHPYDQAVYQMRADALYKGALASALAYRLTGDRADALKGALILKLYADKYSSYPIHGIAGRVGDKNGARVYAQNLDEATFLINMAWTYDLLRDSDVFTAADREHIEKDLLYACAEVTGQHGIGATLNITSWINGALIAVGYTLNDQTLINRAIDGPNGFRAQMKQNIADGFWVEGALGYQFYAIEPLERTAQMAARNGVNLWKQEPNLEALFVSPLGLIFPDGTTPSFNDSNGNLPVLKERASEYEVAYTATHDPLFAAICAEYKRDNREAFLFGVPSIDPSTLPKPKSAVFPIAGYATMRAPVGDLTEIMKFGPHGGSHGHYDKLTEVIFAKGTTMSVDPGSQSYGLPIHFTWDRVTVAHNTLGVDETSQVPATGKLISWQAEPEFTAVTADAGPVYPNADLQRTSLLTSDYVLEITTGQTTDGKEHDFDLSYHNYGVEHPDGNFAPYSGFPQKDGYQHLTENKMAEIAGTFHTRFEMDKGRDMEMWVLGDAGPSQVFTGVGPGPHITNLVPYAIVRRHGASAKFVTLLVPGPTPLKNVTVTAAEDGTIHIRSSMWEDTIAIGSQVTYRRTALP